MVRKWLESHHSILDKDEIKTIYDVLRLCGPGELFERRPISVIPDEEPGIQWCEVMERMSTSIPIPEAQDPIDINHCVFNLGRALFVRVGWEEVLQGATPIPDQHVLFRLLSGLLTLHQHAYIQKKDHFNFPDPTKTRAHEVLHETLNVLYAKYYVTVGAVPDVDEEQEAGVGGSSRWKRRRGCESSWRSGGSSSSQRRRMGGGSIQRRERRRSVSERRGSGKERRRSGKERRRNGSSHRIDESGSGDSRNSSATEGGGAGAGGGAAMKAGGAGAGTGDGRRLLSSVEEAMAGAEGADAAAAALLSG
ncbi:hypothetical protein A4X13_0g7223 [Tilletia indica]|uniref:Uncharacterized protein n=1 Tax=Tilletia indica TaxID=43049 RepID=A0A177T4K1_9BASI|nr:hypothetical protein A4X13_0g7223 [Tilletia indica]